jgi:6-pyruvoyl tetrahydropterin synthase/QueD family protein
MRERAGGAEGVPVADPVHHIRVERNRLRFAAAHMATFGGDCEPLHGHNYDVLIEIEGQLNDDAWVLDFGLVKRLAREICKRLDHRFLLQRGSRLLQAEEVDGNWILRCGAREYRLPSSDVCALPILNSTSEQLSAWFHGQLAAELRRMGIANIRRLSVGIEEMPGQAAWYAADVVGSE